MGGARVALHRIRTDVVYHNPKGLGGLPLGLLYDSVLTCLEPRTLARMALVFKKIKTRSVRWERLWRRLWRTCNLGSLAGLGQFEPRAWRCYSACAAMLPLTRKMTGYAAEATHAMTCANANGCPTLAERNDIRDRGRLVDTPVFSDCPAHPYPCASEIIMSGSEFVVELAFELITELSKLSDGSEFADFDTITTRLPRTFKAAKRAYGTHDEATLAIYGILAQCPKFSIQAPSNTIRRYKSLYTGDRLFFVYKCRDVDYEMRHYLVAEPRVEGGDCLTCGRAFF